MIKLRLLYAIALKFYPTGGILFNYFSGVLFSYYLHTIAKKAYNVSREEWNEVKLFLLQSTQQEINEIIERKDTPMWVLILARGLKRNAAKGITDVLNDMEDRIFGRAISAPEEKEDDIPENIDHGISIDSWIKDKLK